MNTIKAPDGNEFATVVPRQKPTHPHGSSCECDEEDYGCDACDARFDSPLPWYERYGVCDFFYCSGCGADWLRDGAAVVRVVASA